jgi:hypothetical protein
MRLIPDLPPLPPKPETYTYLERLIREEIEDRPTRELALAYLDWVGDATPLRRVNANTPMRKAPPPARLSRRFRT